MSPALKIICGVLLFTTWGGLVVLGLTPVEPFVQTLRDALAMLCGVTVALINPKE